MAKFIDKFTDPTDINAPRFQYDEKILWVLSTVHQTSKEKVYVECKDELDSSGTWLHRDPPHIPSGKYIRKSQILSARNKLVSI